MSLTAQFASHFDSAIQHRGANYFHTGRVRFDSTSTSHIVAIVKGSDRYRVELKREGRKIDATCTCPYYDVDLCKHIWAAILAAEQQPLLQGKSLELVHLGIGEDDFDGDSDEDNDDSGDYTDSERREETQRVLRPILSKPSSADPPSCEPWPPTRELLYVIDVTGAGADGTLYLDVLCRDLKMDGGWSKPKPRYLQREWQQ